MGDQTVEEQAVGIRNLGAGRRTDGGRTCSEVIWTWGSGSWRLGSGGSGIGDQALGIRQWRDQEFWSQTVGECSTIDKICPKIWAKKLPAPKLLKKLSKD